MVFSVVVDEFSIGFVADDEEISFLCQLKNCRKCFFGIDSSGGVVSIADNNGAGFLGDIFLDFLHGR